MSTKPREVVEVLAGLLVIGLLVFGGIKAVAWFMDDEVGEPELEVTAKKLVADYEENEVGAAERYEGKVVKVSGEVREISKGPLGGLSVTLKATWLIGGDVVCEFSRSRAGSLAKLKPGDDVVVVGRVSGRTLNSGSDVTVDDCRLE